MEYSITWKHRGYLKGYHIYVYDPKIAKMQFLGCADNIADSELIIDRHKRAHLPIYEIRMTNGFSETFKAKSDKHAKSKATRLRSFSKGSITLLKEGKCIGQRLIYINKEGQKRWTGWVSNVNIKETDITKEDADEV